MRILVVVQARTGSTRLPGKVMKPLAGRPLLQRQLERIRTASVPFDLIVATTDEPSDEPVRELCHNLDIGVFSGHPTDLLDRHYRAALPFQPDAVVKIPSDCPLIDPAVIDLVLNNWSESGGALDYLSNLHPATYPDGNDVEVMTFDALETAWKEATRDFEREHTTPFLWERPERFRIGNVIWETGLDYSMTHRWTIDYPEDYEFIRRIYDALCREGNEIFSMQQILNFLEQNPSLMKINASFAGVNWYRNYLDDLKTISETEVRKA